MSAGSCSICDKRQLRESIDVWLRSGRTVAATSRHFEVHDDALRRHKISGHHLVKQQTAEETDEEARAKPAQGEEPLVFAGKMRAHVTNQYLRALERGDARSAAAYAREARLGNQQIAELQGEIAVGSTTNIQIGGQDGSLDVAIAVLRALVPWPEARAAVLAALSGAGMTIEAEAEPALIEAGRAQG